MCCLIGIQFLTLTFYGIETIFLDNQTWIFLFFDIFLRILNFISIALIAKINMTFNENIKLTVFKNNNQTEFIENKLKQIKMNVGKSIIDNLIKFRDWWDGVPPKEVIEQMKEEIRKQKEKEKAEQKTDSTIERIWKLFPNQPLNADMGNDSNTDSEIRKRRKKTFEKNPMQIKIEKLNLMIENMIEIGQRFEIKIDAKLRKLEYRMCAFPQKIRNCKRELKLKKKEKIKRELEIKIKKDRKFRFWPKFLTKNKTKIYTNNEEEEGDEEKKEENIENNESDSTSSMSEIASFDSDIYGVMQAFKPTKIHFQFQPIWHTIHIRRLRFYFEYEELEADLINELFQNSMKTHDDYENGIMEIFDCMDIGLNYIIEQNENRIQKLKQFKLPISQENTQSNQKQVSNKKLVFR